MANQPSREEGPRDELPDGRPSQGTLRAELLRRGLASAYIERLLGELDDHYLDLLEERNSSMGAARKLSPELDDAQQRLGEPTQLAIFAAETYHARSFWGRHPWVTYLLGPLPLLVVCWIGFALAFSAVNLAFAHLGVYALGWTEETAANLEKHLYLQAIMIAFVCWYVIVPAPLTAAWLLCRTYRRNALDWRWPIVGCGILAITVGCFEISYRIATEPGQGMLSFGWNYHGSASWMMLSFLPRLVVAMGIGLLLVKRAREQQRQQFEFAG